MDDRGGVEEVGYWEVCVGEGWWRSLNQMDRSTGGIAEDEARRFMIDMKLLKLFEVGRWSVDDLNRILGCCRV